MGGDIKMLVKFLIGAAVIIVIAVVVKLVKFLRQR